MREILFRGKSENGSGWVEGSLRITTIQPADDAPFKHYEIEDTTIGVFPNDFMSGICETVNPETVGQYTGLTDKNGKKIFEGDIIKDDWGKIFKVIFTTTSCGFMVECTVAPNECEKGKYRLGDAWCNTIAVVGNIHDNPELLSKEIPHG